MVSKAHALTLQVANFLKKIQLPRYTKKKEHKMKLLLLLIFVWMFQGCSSDMGNSIQSDPSTTIVCGQLSSGEKATFPSTKELNANNATYLHEGPCYE